jgi:hypothetical protein
VKKDQEKGPRLEIMEVDNVSPAAPKVRAVIKKLKSSEMRPCPECGKMLSTRFNLDRHMASVHKISTLTAVTDTRALDLTWVKEEEPTRVRRPWQWFRAGLAAVQTTTPSLK